MGSHQKKGCYSSEVLTPSVIPFLVVTGDIIPDLTGDYPEAGIYNGKPFYLNSAKERYIFWTDTEYGWAIGILGSYIFFYRNDSNPVGDYQPFPGYGQGVATVSWGVP